MSETDPVVPVFDGHNDTILKLEIAARTNRSAAFAEGNDALHIDLPGARAGGLAGGLWAMFTPTKIEALTEKFDPSDRTNFAEIAQPAALNWTLALFARLKRLAAQLPDDLAICASSQDILHAMEAGRIAMVPHIEGAEAIGADLDALEVLHAAGLRSLGPVWSRHNIFAHGAPMALQQTIDPGDGLTDAGRALVKRCNALRILVDLSHMTEAGFWDVAATTNAPLVASHSNAHAICSSARNLTDAQLRAIGETGGLVGLNFHVAFVRSDGAFRRDTPLSDLLRHLDHMILQAGEDSVALGSDFDGCLPPEDLRGAHRLPNLVAAMRAADYGEGLIHKICHENWLRVLSATID